jgi:hypothetical protein
MLGDDVVMVGPNPFNGQSKVLKIDGTSEYFDNALLEDDKYILCGGHYSKVGCKTTIFIGGPRYPSGLPLASILAIGPK